MPSSACGLWPSLFQLCSHRSVHHCALHQSHVNTVHCGRLTRPVVAQPICVVFTPYLFSLFSRFIFRFLFIFLFQFPGGAPPGMPGGMPGMPGGLPGALGMGPRDMGPGAAVSLAQSLGLSRQEHLMSLAGSSAAAQAAMSAAMSSQANMTLGGPPSSHPSQPKMEAMSNVGLFSIFRNYFLYQIVSVLFIIYSSFSSFPHLFVQHIC